MGRLGGGFRAASDSWSKSPSAPPLPVRPQVGLLEAGLEDVAVARGRTVWHPLAGLDQERVAAGLGGVDDAPAQKGGLAAPAPRRLQRGADPELGDPVLDH